MGFQFGLGAPDTTLKRKFRWLFSIPGVSAVANALPPKKSARPGLSFKEFEFQHVSESIWYPLKVDWKPVSITLYDLKCNENPVFEWFLDLYEIDDNGNNSTNVTFHTIGDNNFKTNCTLELYDGCGNVLDTWVFEGAYPQSIDWGELDMDSSEIVVVEMSLRYERAFFIES